MRYLTLKRWKETEAMGFRLQRTTPVLTVNDNITTYNW